MFIFDYAAPMFFQTGGQIFELDQEFSFFINIKGNSTNVAK